MTRKTTAPVETTFDELYEAHKLIVFKVASSFHITTGFDREELISLGNSLFMEAAQEFDPARGTKFSSWLYRKLVSKTWDYIKTHHPRMEINMSGFSPADVPDEITEDMHLRSLSFRDRMGCISDEARTVINIILESPAEILDLRGGENPRQIRGKIVGYLRKQGWVWEKIWRTISEVKEMAENVEA